MKVIILLWTVMVKTTESSNSACNCRPQECAEIGCCNSGYMIVDTCSCCISCAKDQYEECGGFWRNVGTCRPGLHCCVRGGIVKGQYYGIGNDDSLRICLPRNQGIPGSCSGMPGGTKIVKFPTCKGIVHATTPVITPVTTTVTTTVTKYVTYHPGGGQKGGPFKRSLLALLHGLIGPLSIFKNEVQEMPLYIWCNYNLTGGLTRLDWSVE